MPNFYLNLVTLPVWWYTQGLGLLWEFNKRHFGYAVKATGLAMLVKHLREPLYQDYSKSGMVISFFLRIFLILTKSILLFFKALVLLAVDVVYVVWMPICITLLLLQIIPAK